MAKAKTGPSEEYTPQDETEILDAFDDACDSYYGDPSDWVDEWEEEPEDMDYPTRVEVYADVEWAGTRNHRPHRWLRGDNLDLTAVVAAVAAARRIPTGAERLRTYRATTTRGQVHQLQRTHVGRQYLAEHGITARAMRSWDRGTAKPSKASRDKVATAYEAAATRNITRERTRTAAAAHAVATALSDALTDRYGAPIRLRDITHMELLP
jgi:hypothetical protein